MNETTLVSHSEIKRVFDVNRETLEKPGPGNYHIKDQSLSNKKDFSKHMQSAFGSSDSRKISNLKETLSPGPGAYDDLKN